MSEDSNSHLKLPGKFRAREKHCINNTTATSNSILDGVIRACSHTLVHLQTQKSQGAGEVDQWLRLLASLAQDPGSVASTHVGTYNHP